MTSDADLLVRARAARDRAVCDQSGYAVGAALECADGTVFLGCNIEHPVIGETVCAEKVALLKAISEGHRAFTQVAVFTGSTPPASPCGSCRQMLYHWGVDRVISGNPDGDAVAWTIETLLPAAFRL